MAAKKSPRRNRDESTPLPLDETQELEAVLPFDVTQELEPALVEDLLRDSEPTQSDFDEITVVLPEIPEA